MFTTCNEGAILVNLRISVLCLVVVVFLLGQLNAQTADTVFVNGKVYTVNENQPWAEAVAVKGNKIIYVGDSQGVKQHVGDETKTIDCAGKTVMPGFVSAHDHLIASAWTNAGVQLFDVKDKAECLQRIKEYAAANPDEKVVKGIGWSAGKLGGRPTAKELDQAVPDRPALILDFTIHDAWLNTMALKKANITKDTPDTLPGVTFWVRDDEGNPLGCAIEVQWMQAYIDLGAWDAEKMIRESSDTLSGIAASNGTTTFLSPGVVTPNIKDTHGGMEQDFKIALDMLTRMAESGELKCRTFAQPMFKNKDADPQRFVDFTLDMSKTYNTDKVRVNSMKVHPEGNWNAEVAPMLKPYESGKTGVFNVEPEKITAIMVAAAKANLDVFIHSDSTGSARAAVNGILAGREFFPGSRSAIHHACWIHPDDQKRIIENKIPINTTPLFSSDYTDTDKDAIRSLGKQRTETMFGRYPDFARAGVSVSISADVPSTQPSMQAPLFQVEAACTFKVPSDEANSKKFPTTVEPMTVKQAIRAVTIDPAWQLRMGDKIGSLEVGKLADIVVLESNPFEVEVSQIEEIDVLMTMMDGDFTYVADPDRPRRRW